MTDHQAIIEASFDIIDTMSPKQCPPEVKKAVVSTINKMNQGTLRVAEKIDNDWHVHAWLKKAILLYFRLHENVLHTDNMSHFYDKVPLKYHNQDIETFHREGVRVVPGARVRFGAHIRENTVIMPSFINIGAFVDSGCMIDTWATVGSCAQIGKNVHLSGGAGIGGVLEPLQANPTIIEDNCFIGARSEVAEGVIVEQGAVLAMGTFISQSTKIYDRKTGEITYGRVPAGAVIVPGSLPSQSGNCQLYCAVIVKYVDEKTKQKTGINAILRESMEN